MRPFLAPWGDAGHLSITAVEMIIFRYMGYFRWVSVENKRQDGCAEYGLYKIYKLVAGEILDELFYLRFDPGVLITISNNVLSQHATHLAQLLISPVGKAVILLSVFLE